MNQPSLNVDKTESLDPPTTSPSATLQTSLGPKHVRFEADSGLDDEIRRLETKATTIFTKLYERAEMAQMITDAVKDVFRSFDTAKISRESVREDVTRCLENDPFITPLITSLIDDAGDERASDETAPLPISDRMSIILGTLLLPAVYHGPQALSEILRLVDGTVDDSLSAAEFFDSYRAELVKFPYRLTHARWQDQYLKRNVAARKGKWAGVNACARKCENGNLDLRSAADSQIYCQQSSATDLVTGSSASSELTGDAGSLAAQRHTCVSQPRLSAESVSFTQVRGWSERLCLAAVESQRMEDARKRRAELKMMEDHRKRRASRTPSNNTDFSQMDLPTLTSGMESSKSRVSDAQIKLQQAEDEWKTAQRALMETPDRVTTVFKDASGQERDICALEEEVSQAEIRQQAPDAHGTWEKALHEHQTMLRVRDEGVWWDPTAGPKDTEILDQYRSFQETISEAMSDLYLLGKIVDRY